jgi:hypothetical protein
MTRKFSRVLSATFALVALAALRPSAMAEPMAAITNDAKLIAFDSDLPGTVLVSNSLTGLATGESLVGIDFRPANGQLYAVSSTGKLYTLNLNTGAATQVGTTAFATFTGANFGVDFNPVVDRLRVVSDTGENLRVNPDTGALAGTDTALAYDATDANFGATPAIVAAAYSNNFTGSSSTTLFGLDSTLDSLVSIGSLAGAPTSPNTGALFTRGSVGINATTVAGLDISALSGRTFLAAVRNGQTSSELFHLDLGTGLNISRVGSIGSAQTVSDISSPPLETTVPTVTISTPSRPVVRIRTSTLNFAGTANDNLLLTSVEYRVIRGGKEGVYKLATGLTSWAFTISSLRVGTSVVQVKGTDIFGNESNLGTVTVIRREAARSKRQRMQARHR